MESIKNKRYYHIHRINKSNDEKYKQWEVGETHFFEKNEKNIFNHIFDVCGIAFPNNIGDYGRLNKDDLLQLWNNDKDEAINRLLYVTQHYLKFTREYIFEEVRLKHFPELPSRFSCIWVIPENKDLIRKWSKTFHGNGIIFLVELTGNIHRVKEQYLKLTTDSLDKIRDTAKLYWTKEVKEGEEDECLFEGIVKVIQEIKIEDL